MLISPTYLYSITLGPSINNVDVILLNKAYVVMWTSSLNKLHLVNWATKGERGGQKCPKNGHGSWMTQYIVYNNQKDP